MLEVDMNLMNFMDEGLFFCIFLGGAEKIEEILEENLGEKSRIAGRERRAKCGRKKERRYGKCRPP
ncbi:MAG: hypothetical protein FWG24_05430 [Eggerthellaceae bacterium]|nr:hypothetical protein [Eggerthellaceae bacterium]